MKKLLSVLVWIALATVSVARADEYQEFLDKLAKEESKNNPGAYFPERGGYLGLYQMSEAALVDAGYYIQDDTPNINDWEGTWTGRDGIDNKEDFLANAQAQTNAVTAYHRKLWGYVQDMGLDDLVGEEQQGVTVTQSGLLAGAHLLGASGLSRCLAGIPDACADGNGTSALTYMGILGGYDVTSITMPGGGNGSGGGLMENLKPGETIQGVGGKLVPVQYRPPTLEEIFAQGGVSVTAIRVTIQSITAMTFLLWLAWVVLGHYQAWRNETISTFQFETGIVRATVLVAAVLFVILS